MREEPLGLAQEGLLALHAAQLLEEGQRQDLRVREALDGDRGVALAARVEDPVGVADEAEEDGVKASSVRWRREVW